MSARLHYVTKAQKDQGVCGHCGDKLEKGGAYLWYNLGFRSSYKYKRCTKAACRPRPSELDTSKFSTILAAQEAFEDQIDFLYSKEDIEAAVQEVADAVGEVRDEYQEALDSWEYGNEMLQEKVDHYDSQTYEIDGWTWDGDDDYERCQDHQDDDSELDGDDNPLCDDCDINRSTWLEEMRSAANDVVQSIEQA